MEYTKLSIVVDENTLLRLRQVSTERGEDIEVLAESAVQEEALRYFRHRRDDPANQKG